MGFQILRRRHGAISGGGGIQQDDFSASASSSSSEEEEEGWEDDGDEGEGDEGSYDSFGDENSTPEEEEEEEEEADHDVPHDAAEKSDCASERSASSSSSSFSSSSDGTEVDPALLCPHCGAQTHEYVLLRRRRTAPLRRLLLLRGSRKWRRMAVEDPAVVDAATGECVACRTERVARMREGWLDDIPTLPEALGNDGPQSAGCDDENDANEEMVEPARTEGERYRQFALRNHTKKTTNVNNDEEEQYGDCSFSCGVSIYSDGRSVRTGRTAAAAARLGTLEEVPGREETSVEDEEEDEEDVEDEEESEDSSVEEYGVECNKVGFQEEEVGDVDQQLLAQLGREGAAWRRPGDDEPSHVTPSVATEGKFDDFLAAHAASPFLGADRHDDEAVDAANVWAPSSRRCDQSVAGQNGAIAGEENRNNGASTAAFDVSDVLEQYVSAKDQLSSRRRVAAMKRSFRGMLGGMKHRKVGEAEAHDEQVQSDDTYEVANPFAMPAPAMEQEEAAADGAVPDWAAGLGDDDKGDVAQAMPLNAATLNDPQELYDEAVLMAGGEKDPQLFYNDAVAAVAAANVPGDVNNKTKNKSFKSPFQRKLKGTKEDAAVHEEDIAQMAKLKEDASFDFPDLLPDGGTKEKKSKKSGIKLPKPKKRYGAVTDQVGEENPFLRSNIAPALPTDALKQPPARKMISSMFPDALLSAVPEGRLDDSPPPPVIEIAAGPEDDDEDVANPNTTDVDHLIRGLQSTVDDPRLARKFLISLRTMSIHHPNRLGIAEAGGIHAIVICMQRFKRESAVAKQGCAALQNLVCADKNEQRCVKEGALDAIVRAMMNHSRSPGTQEHGAAALRNLTAGSFSNRTAVAEAGGIEALIEALKVHRRNSNVQDKCCAALANICNKHRANRVAIGEAGGIPYVVQALRIHGYKSRSLAEKGIRCLLNLSHTSRNVEMMKCEEGIEGLILGVAHRHGGKCKEWALKIFLKM